MQYFFGNGAFYVREALRLTPHAQNIVLVGICPSLYPEHPRSFYYRVSGDIGSRFDDRGFVNSGVETLPYSSGSFGIFWISFTDPTFNFAIVNTFMRTAGINEVSRPMTQDTETSLIEMRDLSEQQEANNTDSLEQEESLMGIVGHTVGGVSMTVTSSPNIFYRIQTLLGLPETLAEAEENPTFPNSTIDSLAEIMMNLVRISDAVSIFWIFPIVDTTYNGVLLAVCIGFFGINGICSTFLMLTNPRSRRDRWRNLRIMVLCYRSLGSGMNLFDLSNNVRMAARRHVTSCTVALYAMVTLFGWTVAIQDALQYGFPSVRDAFYRYCLRHRYCLTQRNEDSLQTTGTRFQVTRTHLEDQQMVASILNLSVFGLFFGFVGLMTTFGGLEISPSCRWDAANNRTVGIF
ncbi:DUF687 family protein [Chlamydia pneumoniae]|nr:DUF687 family protein [Chlamydia pneumoniae]